MIRIGFFFRRVGRAGAIMVALVLVATSCRREYRELRPKTPDAAAVRYVRLTDFTPGLQEEDADSPDSTFAAESKNGYEDNAYAMTEGKTLYSKFNCVGCHAHGGGGMGVPLMDDEWIYGHRPEQIFSTIIEGRPNGMPSFGGKIAAYQVWQLVAYVRSMGGLASSAAAPGRDDHMNTAPPENDAPSITPVNGGIRLEDERPE
jgi:cytochrome c oxidase cbb3-type subunit 3